MRTDIDTNKILDLNRRFHDEVEADNYDQRMGVSYTKDAIKATIDELESVLGAPLPSGGNVADLGAGTGNIAIKLALDGRFEEVTAVDISERSLAIANQSASTQGVNINTVVSDMTTLPFEDNSQDLVVGCAFLHHLPDPIAFMQEVGRILKPGAPFVIVGEPTSMGATLTEIVKSPVVLLNNILEKMTKRRLIKWEHDHIDVHTFSKSDLDKLIPATQFEQVRVRNEGFLEPIIDQGLFVPVRHVFSRATLLIKMVDFIRAGLRRLDKAVFNHIMPQSALVTLKISAASK